MKNKIIYVIVLLVVFMAKIQAQTNKLDKIVKKNYEILEVTIVTISENVIEFTYPNETILNKLDVSKVAKVIFKNGRIQEFSITQEKEINSLPNNSDSEALVKKNLIAILPAPFFNMETTATSSENSKMAQNDIYNNLKNHISNIQPLMVQDLRTTNSLLKKEGIDFTNIDETSIEDLQKILGADHIIASKVSYTIEESQYSDIQSTTKVQKQTMVKEKIDDFSSTTTVTEKIFRFTVYLDIYKNGDKIYSELRKPFFTEKDSWIDSVQYLLKRSPIYNKK